MGRKVRVALVDSEDMGSRASQNVTRMVKEAKERMALDRARKASQAKGKLMMAKKNAKVVSGKHARHLKCIANTVGNGSRGKGLFHVGKNQSQGWSRQKCGQSR